MKRSTSYILLFTAIAALSFLSSCRFGCIKGSGNQVTENRKVSDFSKVDISGGYEVTLKQDSSLTVSVSADENLMKFIRTEVSGTKLRVFSRKNFCSNRALKITIGVRSLSEIKTSGAIKLNTTGRINTQNLNMHLSGGSKITMDLSAGNVTTTGSGATELELSGQAASHHIKLSGAGKLNALNFVVGDYKINTSGASQCQINVLKTLDVNTSGASEITYRGNPSTINNQKSGASSIKKIN